MSTRTRDPLTEGATFVELLQRRAVAHGERTAFQFLTAGEEETAALSYAELETRARAIAAGLSEYAGVGDRALLLFPPGLRFIEAFFGCLFAGVVPVPSTPERSHARRPMTRLPALASDADPAVVLTTVDHRDTIAAQIATIPAVFAVPLVAVDEIPSAIADDWTMPAIAGETLALLQYTSGSTGTPRGVMVTHANLLANEEMIRHGMDHDSGLVQVGWLPLFHDMGLIGNVLQPLYVGGKCVLMPPVAFLQQPVRWLQTISRYGGTTSGAPNFAFDLCAGSITDEQKEQLDLSSWRVAFNGAEPVWRATLDRFAAAFAGCGFRPEALYPCYGMAEATLFVAGGVASLPPATLTIDSAALGRGELVSAVDQDLDTRTLVSSGRAWLEEEIRIVDPSSQIECPPDRVGEIWVAGPHVAAGYWRREDETTAAFRGRLAGEDQKNYLRTGDLGLLRAGELFVTGRLKDLIIIRGANHYPHDIERTVGASYPLLRAGAGAAFSIGRDGPDDPVQEERLVVVQEVDRRFKADDAAPCLAAIRREVAETHGLAADAIVLIRTGAIPKTTSGKIQRRLCRDRFLDGTLPVVAEWHLPATAEVQSLRSPATQSSGPEIRAWLLEQIGRLVGVQPADLDPDEPLAAYGLDSVHAVMLATELSVWLGRPFSPTLAWQYPTITRLVSHLAAEAAETSQASVISPPSAGEAGIAVIGLACRFPQAENPEAFWRLLSDGGDAISEVPADRWDAAAYYDPDLVASDAMNTRWGGFLDNIAGFDPRFFGVSPDEAAGMDPQHRLLLEVTWEALEHAGLEPAGIAGSEAGVFIGISSGDFYKLLVGPPGRGATGVASSLAANRLSYFLDLCGPSMAVDSACSSSLLAVHLACESLRAGDCTLALAGGVNVIVAPDLTQALSQAGFLSPTGRCRSFAADADGYVRSEGCGLIVLKRLVDAQRDGNPILAVIRGSAVNQNGRGNGITAPSVAAQTRVITRALEQAGMAPDEIDYIEAHGSGTALGDLIEFQALAHVLGARSPAAAPLVLGSVKTNIGHLEAAAGIAGLIKVILALQQEAIPAHLHAGTLNPHIAETTGAFVFATELLPWKRSSRPRRAGVSSFGFGGANTHVVVEEAPRQAASLPEEPGARYPLFLSARTAGALREMARRLLLHLNDHPDLALRAVCTTLAFGRARFRFRLAAIVASREDVIETLSAWLNGETVPSLFIGTASTEASPEPAGQRFDPLPDRAQQWVSGAQVSWPELGVANAVDRVPLPTYPFERVRCWPDASRIATPARRT